MSIITEPLRTLSDLQSVHNQQLSQANQINAILDIFGVPSSERQRVAQARDVTSDYDLQIDLGNFRSRLLGGLDISALPQSKGQGFVGSPVVQRHRSKPSHKVKDRAVVAFSAPVTPYPEPNDLSMQVPSSRRRDGIYILNGKDKGKSVASAPASEDLMKLRAQLDTVSRVFGANSSLVVFRDSFGLWMRALGWRVEADIMSAIEMGEQWAAERNRSDDDGDGEEPDTSLPARQTANDRGRRSRHVLPVLAYGPEAELQLQNPMRRRQDFLALQLAYQLFVLPAMSGTSTPIGNIASPTASPFLNHGFQTASPTTMSFPPSSSSPGPHRASPTLITRQHILANLPAGPLRTTLWIEFRGVMELHSSVPLKAIGERMDAMFDWAAGVTDDPNGDTGSSSSSHSHLARSVAKKSRRPRGQTGKGESSSSFPPTLSFFALACAAFALGAQAHHAKLVHGFPVGSQDNNNGGIGMPMDGQAMPLPSPNPAAGLPPNMTPHHLHSLSRAALIAHKELDVPPSLDTILAYTLGWLHQLHTTDRFKDQGSVKTTIDGSVCRELGEMVALAKIMGLGHTDESDGQEDDGEGIGVWEKEMRRRVWWELKYWDL